MWVKVVESEQLPAEVLLPRGLWENSHEQSGLLRYGTGSMQVSTGHSPGPATDLAGSQADDPAVILVASSVARALHMRTEPVYRLRVTRGVVEIGPVLGLLLGNRNHWYTNGYLMREAERVTAVSRQVGGLYCAFSPRSVLPGQQAAYGLYYHPVKQRWQYGVVPLPTVMHRRSFHNDQAAVVRLQAEYGVQIFNETRFDKWQLHQVLESDRLFQPHLPATVLAEDTKEVIRLIDRFSQVVLKPAALSRGRGIIFVNHVDRQYRIVDCREVGFPREDLLSPAELITLLEQEICPRYYLCQQRIDLAEIDGAPFDIRVVMQRTPRGQWHCKGIECRLAGNGQLVTNIALGGRALTIEEAIGRAFGTEMDPAVVEGDVIELAERLCYRMDRTGFHFAEFGVDIALDAAGKKWFIESNVLPTFKGFQAISPALYRSILAAPLLYASYVAGFSNTSTNASLSDYPDSWGG